MNVCVHSPSGSPLTPLLLALGDPKGVASVGAGASWPHVPTVATLPNEISQYLPLVSSYSADPLPGLPIRNLLYPIPSHLLKLGWGLAAFERLTGDMIALAVHQAISRAHLHRLPQYDVFRLMPLSYRVVSFNWDGLARSRCPQRSVVHPHGCVKPFVVPQSFVRNFVENAQFCDDSDGKSILGNSVVLLGEEGHLVCGELRRKVHTWWRCAGTIVIVGYSFGLGSTLNYDAIWLEEFVDAIGTGGTPIHIVDPRATTIRNELSERLGRAINVFSWPLSWLSLSRAILKVSNSSGAATMSEMFKYEREIRRSYDLNEEELAA